MGDNYTSVRKTYLRKRYRVIDTVPGIYGGDPKPGTTDTNPLTKTDFRDGNNNPKWRDQVRRHVSATTSLTAERYTFKGGYGEHYGAYKDSRKNLKEMLVIGCVIPMSDAKQTFSAFGDTAENQARTKFYKGLKNTQTAFNGGTFIGELGESLRMLKKPGMALRRGLDDYMKDVKKRASGKKSKKALSRAVAGTWLEHAFGWTPFISDVKSAGDALNKRLDRYDASYSKVTGTGLEEMSSCPTTWATSTSGEGFIERRWRAFHINVKSVRYKAEWKNEAVVNNVRANVRLFGVDWRDIVPTAWELIPYSFLVDYFTNIGDVLTALSTRKDDLAWCVRTERTRYMKTSCDMAFTKGYMLAHPLVTSANNPNGTIERLSAEPCKYTESRIVRTAAFPPYPTFRLWEVPGFGKKWINMSALLASRNKTRRALFS